MGHPQTTLRISLVSLSLCHLWFALLLLVFLSPSGKPSQSRRRILAGEGLKNDRIHVKHIGLSGGPQNAQHQAERTTLGSSW